ncbi:MAG: tetratricopeptide repeat protein [Armatimonadetes bacterium]|nr:tetratricopeptide repeat protein [Armatimonadota bacterium]
MKPSVFIAYAWDTVDHNQWVGDLVAELKGKDIEVRFDGNHPTNQSEVPYFMERAIEECQFFVIIATPKYRQRWFDRDGAVGYEAKMMASELLYRDSCHRFLPVLRSSNWVESAPLPLRWMKYLDADQKSAIEVADEIAKYVLKGEPLNVPGFEESPIGSLWMLPVLPSQFHTGQADKLAQLRQDFVQHKAVGIVPVEGLVGEGGIGKTELALQYCQAYQKDYREILWLNGTSRVSLLSDLGRAKEGILGNYDGLDGQPDATLKRALKMIDHLRGQPDWLVVLDNVDNPEHLETEDRRATEEAKQEVSLYRPLLRLREGHLLITSRQEFWGDLAHTMRLDVLGEEDGALLFLKRTLHRPEAASLEEFSEEDVQAGLEFSREVGGFQLALEQGGATARTYQWRPARYLKEFRARFEEMIAKRGVGVDRHEDAVYATVLTSLEEIAKVEPRAREFVMWCAYLPSDWIVEEVFRVEEGPVFESIRGVPLEDLILMARGQSLIHLAEGDVYAMHRLVQRVIRAIDSGSEEGSPDWYEALVVAANSVDPGEEFEHWKERERLIPVWRFLANRAPECEALIQCLCSIVSHGLHASGAMGVLAESKRANDLAGLLLQESSRLLLEALSGYGSALHAYARFGEAVDLREEEVRLCEKYFGKVDKDTLTAENNLAMTYLELQRYDEALELQEKVWKLRSDLFGPRHPDTVLAMNNLAGTYNRMGRHTKALPIQEEVRKLRFEIHGEQHPDTLLSMNNLAHTYWYVGRPDEAIALMRQAVNGRLVALGPHHPSTKKSQQSLAKMLEGVSNES